MIALLQAATTAASADWREILASALATILVGVAAVTARAIGRYFESKGLVEKNAHLDAVLEDIAAKAVRATEQKAVAAVKAKAPPLGGSEKLEAALDFAAAEVARRGLPVVARDALARSIESKLGEFNWYAEKPSGEAP